MCSMETARESVEKIIENIQRVFSGKREIIELALNSLFGGGHLLIVDRPGVGKTTLARALAISIGGETKRIQFTPDLLPTDITGVNIYIQEKGEFRFHKGPVFTNILLADEINRATPRAQSSLLEAMEESQVSVDGVTYPLENPFCVIATQNPIEIQGTFPLPEAQLDRFLLSLSIGYPTREEERRILDDRMERDPISSIGPVMDAKSVEMIKNTIRNKVHISDAVKKYILDIT
ncbi:MAG TPA: AAA family ATPase, partial [bacterium]|nr:AAA family ATPase [bacterium]